MSSDVQIHLTNFNNFYTPGQEVTGRVDCNFISETTIKAVFIVFEGRCCTNWKESQEYYDDFFKENRTRFVNYIGEEVYFHKKINLTGISSVSLRLYAGMHSYNFSYRLPKHLPSSYESQNGWGSVRYRVKGVINKSCAFDSEAFAVLLVVSPLDLNYIPRIREPVEISVDKVLCSCFCKNTDPLTFTFTLPTIGYVPSQVVQVGAYIQNLTTASVESVTFKITKLTEYICQTPNRSTKYDKQIISTYGCDRINARSEKSWTATLQLPETLLYPNMVPCNLINITYKLEGEVVLPFPHSNLTASVPLRIGNVPIRNMEFNSLLASPSRPTNSGAPNYGFLIPSSEYCKIYGALPLAPELPPPSYEEVLRAQNSCDFLLYVYVQVMEIVAMYCMYLSCLRRNLYIGLPRKRKKTHLLCNILYEETKHVLEKNPKVNIPIISKIHLTNVDKFYIPGQEVIGRVECNFTSETTVTGVLVIFDGRCCTGWRERPRRCNDRTRYVMYRGEEVYFNDALHLAGMTNAPLRLHKGAHRYDFTYRLPKRLPSSYESQNQWGTIQYTIKAIIVNSWAFNKEAFAVFNVISPLDLNYIPRIREPVETSMDRVLCSCFCSNCKRLTFTFILPTIGYVPGQEVKIGVYVENLTSINTDNVTFKITKLSEYMTESPKTSVRLNEETVASYLFDGIRARDKKSWAVKLQLPETICYPNMKFCKLINISYNLKGKIVLPYPHRNLSSSVPLAIGNVQIRDMDLNSLSILPSECSTASALLPPSGIYRNYGALKRPSYEGVYGEHLCYECHECTLYE